MKCRVCNREAECFKFNGVDCCGSSRCIKEILSVESIVSESIHPFNRCEVSDTCIYSEPIEFPPFIHKPSFNDVHTSSSDRPLRNDAYDDIVLVINGTPDEGCYSCKKVCSTYPTFVGEKHFCNDCTVKEKHLDYLSPSQRIFQRR